MATAQEQNALHNSATLDGKETNGTSAIDHAGNGTTKQRNPYDFGGNPLAHVRTNDPELRLPAFGGEFQPGLYRAPKRNLANPAPLGLSAFALTTFVLSLVNLGTRDLSEPNIVVGAAFGYGGLVQLLAGMWEMAVGNTFGATALSSYGGFWISFAIILTPGGFQIKDTLEADGPAPFLNSMGLYLMVSAIHPDIDMLETNGNQGWFIFTFLLLICTLRSTVAFFLLFFFLDLAFLMLGIAYLYNGTGAPNSACLTAGGVFGILAAFVAWYNALAGLADSSNSFFVIPVAHFPWSEKGRERRGKTNNHEATA